MYFLYIITFLAVLISFYKNKVKTIIALKYAFNKFKEILPALLIMIFFVSVILYFIPENLLVKHLKENNLFLSVIAAVLIGSITLMPGFIAFPLCGILLKKGAAYTVLSGFSTSLMMVGILTYPLEKIYFGHKVTILRNIIGLFIALTIAFFTGLFFGEIF